MNKKPLWRRVNRGFVVSMALLAAVIIYVVVTQVLLSYDRRDIKSLAAQYCGYMESTSQLSSSDISKFQNDTALASETSRLKSELSGLFLSDSDYLDAAVSTLVGNIQTQTEEMERITSRSAVKSKVNSCVIDQDVATYTVTYTYTVSGKFMNYSTGALEDQTNATEELYLSVLCKKVDGEWKIYRISNAYWSQPGNENAKEAY